MAIKRTSRARPAPDRRHEIGAYDATRVFVRSDTRPSGLEAAKIASRPSAMTSLSESKMCPGLVSHDELMKQLTAYPYQKIRASSDFAPPGANLERRMEGWESMPYPQPDTIQEIIVAVQRKQLAPEDLDAVRGAIESRQQRSARTRREGRRAENM